MNRMLIQLVAVAMSVNAAWAEAPSQNDQRQMQDIIAAQLDAFARGDAVAAYDFAAPVLHHIFPTPDIFMTMVERGYPPVFRNRAHRFGESFEGPHGRPSTRVTLTGADGKTYDAIYGFERQPDGSWKIISCTLTEKADMNV